MPDFWEYPTVSMGLGPILSIYQARFNKYLENRRIDDAAGSRVWCFLGDGECDEPETLGSISLAAREHLDNLTWVINCNLQRLDGPVRGNGKIIQELEAIFRGAGWNVIKVIWGSRWDELLIRDTDGVLLNQMNTTVDGEFQRYAIEDGNYIRENFFGPDPRLRAMVEHLTDDDLTKLPRGGHDYRKLYAAYRAAVETKGVPTVILAKTVKGWTLGAGVEGRNATHQIKKMIGRAAPRPAGPPPPGRRSSRNADVADGWPPYVRPAPDSAETHYLLDRRKALDGPLPSRTLPVRRPIGQASPDAFDELLAGSGNQPVSTTTAFTRLLRNLCRDDEHRAARRADHPRRGPHLRHGLAVPRSRDLRLPGPAVRTRRPRPAAELQGVHRRPDPRGGHHRGRRTGVVDGSGDQPRPPGRADGALLHLLFDVRVPARRRPHLGCRGRPCHVASSWAPPPVAPP